MYSPSIIAIILATSGLVSGHGIIQNVQVNGKTYPGATGPGSDPSNSPVRAVSSGDPIDDVTSPMMLCGRDSKQAPMSITVAPGDKVEVAWQAETGIKWFHNVGPVQTYMASCGGDCKDFTPSSSTQWFKISELGLKSDGKTWYQADMNNGASLSATIPSDLADGNYLFRHEILALQNGMTKDLAEFYPNCVQMTVSGGSKPNANTTPSPTVTFPGAYKDTDPGILVNVYNPGLQYSFPGPAVADIAKGSSSSSGSDPAPSQSSSSAPAPTSAPANAAPSPSAPASAPARTSTGSTNSTGSGSSRTCKRNSKRSQKRALRAHAKRRMAEASY